MGAFKPELILTQKKGENIIPLSFPLNTLKNTVLLFQRNDRSGTEGTISPKEGYRIYLRSEEPEETDKEEIQKISVFINDIPISEKSPNRNDRDLIYDSESGILIESNPVKLQEILAECYGTVQFSVTLRLKADNETGFRTERYFTDYIRIIWDEDTQADIDAMISYIKDFPLTDPDPEVRRAGAEYPLRIAQNADDDFDDIWSRKIETERRIEHHKWAAHIQLAGEISSEYNRNYGYFRTTPSTCIKKENRINRIERMQTVTPDTLQYIAQHPEYLQSVEGNRGIPVNGHCYAPQKARIIQNVASADTFENRTVLGFLTGVIEDLHRDSDDISAELRLLEDELEPLKFQLAELKEEKSALEEKLSETEKKKDINLKNLKKKINRLGNRISQPEQQLLELNDWKSMLSALFEELNRLFFMYRSALNIDFQSVHTLPGATAVFQSVMPYRMIYECMRRWFNFSKYSLDDNELFLPLTRLSNLYERYFLTLLIRYFSSRFKNESGEAFKPVSVFFPYERPKTDFTPEEPDWDYSEAFGGSPNTFAFTTPEGYRLTLYYQPIIYTAQSKTGGMDNGIALHRSSLLTFKNFGKIISAENASEYKTALLGALNSPVEKNINFYHYKPDFLVKLERPKEKDRYMILDTKFSSRETVRTRIVKDLIFKYILSIDEDEDSSEDKRSEKNRQGKPALKEPRRIDRGTNLLYIVYGQHYYPDFNSRTASELKADEQLNSYPYTGIVPVFATKVGEYGGSLREDEEYNFRTLDLMFDPFLEK